MSQPQPSLAIRIEDVVKFPPPGLAIPTAVEFAPDGTHVTFLWSPEGTLTRQLFVHNWQTEETRELFSPPDGGATEDNLSPEEKLRRERLRERGLGITRYRWAEDGERFIVPLLGEVWVQDRLRGAPHQVVDSDHEPAIDPRLSRDGRFIAYVHDAELYVVPAEGGTARQLTDGARGTGKTHGLAEYIAQEEMGRQEGFWWSYDGELLAFTEVDETHIPAYRIVHQGRDTPGHEDHSYPFAGQPNAKVRLGVGPRRGGRVTWMDLQMDGEDPADLYLARVHWMPDGALLAEVENRAQSRLDLLALDPKTGRRSVVLTERSDVWINLHHLFHPLESGAGGFVLGSERSGFMHLYLYDRRGALVRPLTEGSWQVDALEGVDEANGWVYFTATRDGATQRHLYRVALAGGPIVKLTTSPGMHSIVMDRAHERFIDTVSSIDQPPTITIRRASDGEALGEIPISGDPRIAALQLRPPELVTLATRDGVELHGAPYRPRSEPPYPVVVSVYGGPQASGCKTRGP